MQGAIQGRRAPEDVEAWQESAGVLHGAIAGLRARRLGCLVAQRQFGNNEYLVEGLQHTIHSCESPALRKAHYATQALEAALRGVMQHREGRRYSP